MPKKFIYNVHDKNDNLIHHYQCELNAEQCKANTKNGEGPRCKRKCITPFEYCPAHLAMIKHLKVKDSPIAGKGLFAFDRNKDDNEIVFKVNPKNKIKPKITDYEGETITKSQLHNRYLNYTAPYGYCKADGKCVDSACKRGLGSFANSSNKSNNASLGVGTFSVRATKNIRNNHEITVAYGRNRGKYKFKEPGVSYETKPFYPKKNSKKKKK